VTYNPRDDFAKSVQACYDELRQRPPETWPQCLRRETSMYYTITDFDSDGKRGIVVRAELETLKDFNELIKKLLEKRDTTYPQKEESK
jgi:hypothetical protein